MKIKKEYEDLIPKPTEKDYKILKNSIQKLGLQIPIEINENNEILDGHQRYEICKELDIKPRFIVKKFKDKFEEKTWVIESNLARRQLNDFQKAELSIPLLEIEKELAREREETGKTLASNEGRVGEATEIVSKKIGLSKPTFERAVKIIKEAPEKIKEKVRKGDMSIAYAYKMVKNKEKINISLLPNGQFNVIYADPPWEYFLPLRGSPNMHYPTMAIEEICKLKIPTSKNAILFLWTTAPKLEEALQVINAWGFKYKTNAVWVKDKIGTGYYFRGQHEILLTAKKGNFSPPLEKNRVSSVINSPRTQHSSKPSIVYEIIEKMYPMGKYLELFARNTRKGWKGWGLEYGNNNK